VINAAIVLCNAVIIIDNAKESRQPIINDDGTGACVRVCVCVSRTMIARVLSAIAML
jgi:hypothetical protein